jgi:hypothetical protein
VPEPFDSVFHPWKVYPLRVNVFVGRALFVEEIMASIDPLPRLGLNSTMAPQTLVGVPKLKLMTALDVPQYLTILSEVLTKESDAIVVKEFGNERIVVEVLSKALSESVVRPSGRMSFSTPKFTKAAPPIEVKPVPKVTELIRVP